MGYTIVTRCRRIGKLTSSWACRVGPPNMALARSTHLWPPTADLS
ncbi:hypothetical protein I41_22810 [Lacipirellula limnantheis]|uniref:Uncharacterized protein n=1 Tax=Lacipirellula limnantheis TaxID=2528024 RepID=A0A517TXI9_9BACT|nr:hypothetical protein I41_22810 [Lacipirellula limnantheis]